MGISFDNNGEKSIPKDQPIEIIKLYRISQTYKIRINWKQHRFN